MKLTVIILIAFLVLVDITLGAVGGVGVYDPSSTTQSSQVPPDSASSLSTGFQAQVAGQGSGQPMDSGYNPYGGYQGSIQRPSSYPQGTSQVYVPVRTSQGAQMPQAISSSGSFAQASSASEEPQIRGPYQDGFSPEALSIQRPTSESFRSDSDLNFVSAAPPVGISTEPNDVQGYGAQATGRGSGPWYYPDSVGSRNKFYVQTSSGFRTSGGCSLGGYLPLWSDIAASGNFYVYEWYPGRVTPSIRWWDWAWPGFKKGWFNGDVPGWHVLCFNCRDWSNYIYIYVWPSQSYSGQPYQGPSSSGQYNPGQQSGYTSPYDQSPSWPSGAPMPPEINSENLVMPDYRQLSQGEYGTLNPYPGQPQQTFAAQPQAIALPQGTIYPKCASYRSNGYYIQAWPGRLDVVAGVKCGQWLPLWSKIIKPGNYWSFEWYQCQGSLPGYYCQPEVRNFGYKGAGWYQTWFCGNRPGWHVLAYCCNDWSNYAYIYVWPSSS